MKKKSRAVFLDRDGTINKMVFNTDHGILDSPLSSGQLELLSGASRALSLLKKGGFLLVLISNQPGVAKGKMKMGDFLEIDRRLDFLLSKSGTRFDAKFYCLHHPDAKVKSLRRRCLCRKPKPGLILRAARELGINLAESYMVGDGITDIQAGLSAGCKTVFIGNFKPELWNYLKGGKKPDIIAKSLLEAARSII